MATNDATVAASANGDTTTTTAGVDEAMPDAPAAAAAAQHPNGAAQASASSQPQVQSQSQSQAQSQSQTQPPPPPAGPRASRLQDLFASSLHHTLSKISWPNFAACYPTAAARNPVTLQAVHRAMVERLRELCATEFSVILRNRDVVRRLNELEGLAADARKRRETAGDNTSLPPPPPHTLPPDTVLAAHLRPQRRAQRQQLEARLAAAQADNAARFARLAAQQAEAEQLVAVLERALADAARAAALLDGGGEEGEGEGEEEEKGTGQLLTELARETRAAEAEMSGNA